MHSTDTNPVASSHVEVGTASLITMMAGLASQSMIFGLPGPLLPALARFYGAHGQSMAQMLFAFASLGLMLTSITSGLIVRAMGVRPMLIFALVLYAVAGSVPAFISNIPLLLASRLLVGAGCGLLTTACTMLLAHSFFGPARGRVIGYQTATGSIVGLVVLMIAGATVTRFGWQLPFLLYGLAALPIVVLAIVGVPPVPLPAQTGSGGFGHAFIRTWPICVAGCLLMMVPLTVGSNGPFLLASIGVTAPVSQSVIISTFTVMSALGGVVFGRCQMALGVPRTFILSLVLGAVGMVCIGYASTGLMAAAGYILVGFATGLFIPHLWVLSTTLVAAEMQGYAIGLLTTSMFLGGFLYPFLIGPLQHLLGLPAALAVVGALLGLAAIYMALAGRTRLAGATPRLA
jgi:MFS family permease